MRLLAQPTETQIGTRDSKALTEQAAWYVNILDTANHSNGQQKSISESRCQ